MTTNDKVVQEFTLEHLQNCIQDPVFKVPVAAE